MSNDLYSVPTGVPGNPTAVVFAPSTRGGPPEERITITPTAGITVYTGYPENHRTGVVITLLPGSEYSVLGASYVRVSASGSSQTVSTTPVSSAGTTAASSPASNRGGAQTFQAYITGTDTPSPKSKISCTRFQQSDAVFNCKYETPQKNTGPIAAAGVMAGLFLITLGALIFLLFRHRKAAGGGDVTYEETAEAKTIGHLNARNANLAFELEERGAQLAAAQTTLLRSHSVPPSIDDRSVSKRFRTIQWELKDWIIAHFGSTEQRLDLSPELRAILISQVPLFDKLLQQQRSRTTLLRAVAGYVIQQAFETGEFVGLGGEFTALEESVAKNTSATEFNRWRCETFTILTKSSTAESKAQVVASISERIDTLLAPFCTTRDSRERLQFLLRIVDSAASLALELGCQLARFKVLSERAETPFRNDTMEDVFQEHETHTDPYVGNMVNALDGKPIQAVVFPSVVKWGTERGENYEEMTVVSKAVVLA